MLVTCESCKAIYKLEDSRISVEGIKARCSKCKHVFTVRREVQDDFLSGYEKSSERLLREEKEKETSAGEKTMEVENRRHPRFETALPIHFNLNPDYHVVVEIRKIGVGGTIRNISYEGLLIDSRMDLLDVCQIFSEEMDDHSAFHLEVVYTDQREKRHLMRGAVRWYRLSESERDIQQFQGGLYLKDAESRALARNIVESIIPKTTNRARGASVKTELN